MPSEVTLTIDGIKTTVPEGTTILQAAKMLGIDIPNLCYHQACKPNAVCRTCVVEVEGARVLQASCVAMVSRDMVVKTRSPRVERSRRTILEMLFSAVDISEMPDALTMAADYSINSERFPRASQRRHPIKDDNPMYIREYSKCILCWRCVQVCAEDAQYTYAINYSGRGYNTQISTYFNKPLSATSCVFCGQCVAVCPSGALKSKREHLLEKGINPNGVFLATRQAKKNKRLVKKL